MRSPVDPRPRWRVVVADDHPIFREGLIRVLESRGFEVIGAATDGDEALPLVASLKPDLLLLDLAMPRMAGLVALRELSGMQVETKIILLTAAAEPAEIATALQLGARAIVLKESASEVLFRCIEKVIDGQYWVGRQPVRDLVGLLRDLTASSPTDVRRQFGLTPREREMIGAIVEGLSNADIAKRFSISENTVKHHLTSIFDKLGVSNRLELALFALHHRLDTEPDRHPSSTR
jgi:two-component system, NarL family, nitrate/nitrite response regulator NarL